MIHRANNMINKYLYKIVQLRTQSCIRPYPVQIRIGLRYMQVRVHGLGGIVVLITEAGI